jgi:5-amino-6-(5-phosphoribosylamino)uracil reductase
VPLERLHPEGPAERTAAEAISGFRFHERAPDERPYLAMNMVSTADGKAAVEGRTRAISSEPDREVFHHLRTQFDAVMVGAGTVRTERYGPITKTQELQAKREREGVRPDALAVIVSGSLNLPEDVPLLQDPASHVLILTKSDAELAGVKARVEYLRPSGGMDLRPMMEQLRTEYDVRSVLCEGGPTLNASLVPYGLVDELFLTISPLLAGGADALTILAGQPLPDLQGLGLLSVMRAEDELFLRYAFRR